MLVLHAFVERLRLGCIFLSGGLSGMAMVRAAEVGGISVARLCGRVGVMAGGCRIEAGLPLEPGLV